MYFIQKIFAVDWLDYTPMLTIVSLCFAAVVYIADFVYQKDGQTVVEDVKGFRDPSSATYAKFVLKRKMMLWIHGIRIKEI